MTMFDPMYPRATNDRLGEYSNDNFDDDRVNTPLKKYQEAIDDINDELEET